MGNCPTRSQIATIQMKEGEYRGEYKTGTGYNHDRGRVTDDTKYHTERGLLNLMRMHIYQK